MYRAQFQKLKDIFSETTLKGNQSSDYFYALDISSQFIHSAVFKSTDLRTKFEINRPYNYHIKQKCR